MDDPHPFYEFRTKRYGYRLVVFLKGRTVRRLSRLGSLRGGKAENQNSGKSRHCASCVKAIQYNTTKTSRITHKQKLNRIGRTLQFDLSGFFTHEVTKVSLTPTGAPTRRQTGFGRSSERLTCLLVMGNWSIASGLSAF